MRRPFGLAGDRSLRFSVRILYACSQSRASESRRKLVLACIHADSYNGFPAVGAEQMAEHGRQYNFSVDGKQFHSAERVITGLAIKTRAGVGANFGLFLEGHGRDPDRPVGDTEAIDLSIPGHEKFYTVPPATFGLDSAGAITLFGPADGQLEQLQARFPEARTDALEDGGLLLTIPELPLPDGWNRTSAEICFALSPAYPVAKPDCFFADEHLRLANGSMPANARIQPHPLTKQSALWFSYHGVTWKADRDTYLSFVRMIQRRLAEVR